MLVGSIKRHPYRWLGMSLLAVAVVLVGVFLSAAAALILAVLLGLNFALVWSETFRAEGWQSWSRSRFDDTPSARRGSQRKR